MKISFYTKLSLQVIVLFVCIMAVNLIPDLFPDGWFYYYCKGGVHNHSMIPEHTFPVYHWTFQRWMFLIMGIVLFIIQFARIVGLMHKHLDEETTNKP